MEIMAILELIPVVLTGVEGLKRFIPKKKQKVVNPILAVVTGLVSAYTVGGVEEVMSVLIVGATAGAGAIGYYKIPKVIGRKLGLDA